MQFSFFNIMALNHESQTPQQVMDTTKEAVRVADDLGFDAAWFAEHHFSAFSICGSPLMMAMHCAGFTKRIRLGPGVLVVPLHAPLRMIEEIGMLDAASHGRAIIGIGTGHQPHEFRSMGVAMDERRERLFEGWDLLEMAFSERRAAYDGAHLKVPETVFSITPPVAPELYVATHDTVVMARAALRGRPIFISAGPRLTEVAAKSRAEVLAAAAGAGVTENAVKIAVLRYTFVTESRAEARRAAEGIIPFMRRMRSLRDDDPPRRGIHLEQVPFAGEPDVDWLLENAAIGDADVVAERLLRDIPVLRPHHVAYYMGFSWLPGEAVVRSVRLFGERVLPRLREAANAAASAPRKPRAAAPSPR